MVNISQRPAEVEDRAIPAIGKAIYSWAGTTKSAIGTLVERSSRYFMLLHLPNGHSPAQVEQAIVAATQKLPDFIWKSLTWDQGKEMSNHLQIKVATGLQVYFCDRPAPGNEARTRTPTGYFGNISLREPTSASTAPTISTSSPLR